MLFPIDLGRKRIGEVLWQGPYKITIITKHNLNIFDETKNIKPRQAASLQSDLDMILRSIGSSQNISTAKL